jgi:hypothetical protein
VITSHYAEPVTLAVARAAPLLSAPGLDSELVCELRCGDRFEMLDDSLGWAWGYGGPERRVGYVPSEALANPPC